MTEDSGGSTADINAGESTIDVMTENTTRQYGEATEVPEIGQSTLLSCQHCGKIYYSKHYLTKHIEENHSPQPDAEKVMASDTNQETILFESNSEEGITQEENVEHANMENGEILEEGTSFG